jgi:hypothetical protein
MTLVVNLFAGPGAGKSTHAAGVFAALKVAGVKAEFVSEFAKDLVWEDRLRALRYQPYVTGEQAFRVARLFGQVDVVVTDSPILCALVYQGEGYTPAYGVAVLEIFRSWRTRNYLLQRSRQYVYDAAGRMEDEAEAREVDARFLGLLHTHEIEHACIQVGADSIKAITDDILRELGR